ncbi:MAG: hypothetical protein AAB363_01785, partial [Planctomycetota bacterium]
HGLEHPAPQFLQAHPTFVVVKANAQTSPTANVANLRIQPRFIKFLLTLIISLPAPPLGPVVYGGIH